MGGRLAPLPESERLTSHLSLFITGRVFRHPNNAIGSINLRRQGATSAHVGKTTSCQHVLRPPPSVAASLLAPDPRWLRGKIAADGCAPQRRRRVTPRATCRANECHARVALRCGVFPGSGCGLRRKQRNINCPQHPSVAARPGFFDVRGGVLNLAFRQYFIEGTLAEFREQFHSYQIGYI